MKVLGSAGALTAIALAVGLAIALWTEPAAKAAVEGPIVARLPVFAVSAGSIWLALMIVRHVYLTRNPRNG